jgi:hypothetical protein
VHCCVFLRTSPVRSQEPCGACTPAPITYFSRLTSLPRMDRFAAKMRLLNPTKPLPPKTRAALEQAGWDPHSVELLGMVDKETLSNLTRTFGDEDSRLARLRSGGSCEETVSVSANKQDGRRYVVHGQTGISHQKKKVCSSFTSAHVCGVRE